MLRNDAGSSLQEARNWGLRFEPSPDRMDPSLSPLRARSAADRERGVFLPAIRTLSCSNVCVGGPLTPESLEKGDESD